MITRRTLFGFIAAPAIVRVTSIMPINPALVPFPDRSHWKPRHWEYFKILVDTGLRTMREHYPAGITSHVVQFCELSAWVGVESQISIELMLSSHYPLTASHEELDRIFTVRS